MPRTPAPEPPPRWLDADQQRAWHAIEAAAVGPVALVRRLFFEGLPAELLAPFSDALEKVYEHILENGSLPRPS
jgi:hypothetical protein